MVSFVKGRRHACAHLPVAFVLATRSFAPLAGAVLIAASAAVGAQPLSAASAQATTDSAAPASAGSRAVSRSATANPSSVSSPAWAALTPAQRATLKPLEREWGAIDGNRRQKWLDIAGRMPRMSADDQARVQARMVEWAAMTPQQRAQVRMLFQEAKQVAPQNRKESWDAYQALPTDERLRLAARAASEAAPAASVPASEAARRGARSDRARDGTAQAKSNIVATPALSPAPRAVAPTVVQAQPGATTTLMSRRAVPPSHQQVGLPKIAATPDFVDGVTLLPQRGAQGAAVRTPAAEPAARP